MTSLRIIASLLLCTLIFSLYAEKEYCYFQAPASWDMQLFTCDDPVEVGFLGPANDTSRPNIYLSEEEVDCTLAEYVTSVKNLYKNNPHFTFKDIGALNTKSGKAHLAEIESTTKIGVIKMLQCIIVKDKRAYVLTGANAKKNFTDTHLEYLKTFKSAQISKKPLEFITGADLQKSVTELVDTAVSTKELASLLDQKKELSPYLKKLLIDFHQKKLSSK